MEDSGFGEAEESGFGDAEENGLGDAVVGPAELARLRPGPVKLSLSFGPLKQLPIFAGSSDGSGRNVGN